MNLVCKKKKPKFFVGTSGWFYSWNPEKSLASYINYTGFNTVELNASFYRFPFPNQVKNWAKIGCTLRWSVKTTRLITHMHKFSREKCIDIWQKFYTLFQPLDSYVDFYLFQAHPKFSDEKKPELEEFVNSINLEKRFAFEARHPSWFSKKNYIWAKKLGITFVSVDSPHHEQIVINTSGIIYLRMHGRKNWYSYNYKDKELEEIKNEILKSRNLNKVFIFFNNDTDMFENAKIMRAMLMQEL